MAKKGEKGKKATNQEVVDRLEMAGTLLLKGMNKCDIKRALARYYNISTKMAEIYIGRARAVLLKDSGRPENEHRADAYALYKGMVEDQSLKPLTRLRAQELMVKLLGIEGPQRVEFSGQLNLNGLRKDLFNEAGYVAGERERAVQGDAQSGAVGSNGDGR